MATVLIRYGSDVVRMTWRGEEASAPILLDGRATGYQTADARHYTERAVRLCCERAWGRLYETADDAAADGADPTAQACCVWDDVEYDTEGNDWSA